MLPGLAVDFPQLDELVRIADVPRGRFQPEPALIRRFHEAKLAGQPEVTAKDFAPIPALLAVAGIVLHDMGKVQEYSRLEPGMAKASFTRAGNLHGHLVLGAFIVRAHGTKVGLEASLMERLEHILLSHHTMREYGACATPSTPEAVFVARPGRRAFVACGRFDKLKGFARLKIGRAHV